MKYLPLLAISFLLAMCSTPGPYPGYEEMENGLFIQKIRYNENSKHAEDGDILGDILLVNYYYATSTDSILFSSESRGGSVPLPPLKNNQYKGDIAEGLRILGEGDSVSLLTPADSFFRFYMNRPLPEFIEQGSMLKFNIGVSKVMTQEEFEKEQIAKMQAAYEQELTALANYLKENELTIEPTPSGMYYIETEQGSGPIPQNGETVQVHYTGMLLDGRVFDSSFDRGEPLAFILGQNQVIKGWEEGISYMNEGGKARLIIPSPLAYGDSQVPGSIIGPYSTLIFDVELVKVGQ